MAAGLIWNTYSTACADSDPDTLATVWIFVLMGLWVIAGLIHGVIIVGRFIKQSPPVDKLYDGPFVRKVVLPMNVCYGLVVVLSLIGVIFIHTKHSSTKCTDSWNAVLAHAYTMMIIAILMLLKVGRGQSSSPTKEDAKEEDAKKEEGV